VDSEEELDNEGGLDEDLGEEVEEELLFLRLREEDDFISILRN
jgi:hypothetical protein